MEGLRLPKLLRNLTNSAAKFAYRVPASAQAAASAVLLFTGNPAAGDTFTIGEFTYTFKTALLNPNDILIGPNSTVTARNTLAAVTTDAGLQTNENVMYGPNTAANPVIGFAGPLTTSAVGFAPLGPGSGSAAYIPIVTFVATVVGASMNGVNVSESSTSLMFLFDTVSVSHVTTTLQGGVNPTLNNAITAASSWLEFVDPDTNVVKSQVLNDAFGRFYFASPSQQPGYNTSQRIAAGQPSFLLGLNPPLVAPIVSAVGGGAQILLPSTTQLGSGTQSVSASTVWLVPVVPNAAMALQDIVFMPGATDANVQYAGVIYADNGIGVGPGSQTTPGQLLSVGTVETGITSGIEAISQFSNAPGLIANSPYWIGIIIDTTELIAKATPASSTSFEFAAPFNNGPPGFAPNGTPNQADLQMWGVFDSDAIIEARSYVYTYASLFQEESAPSPFTIASGWNNGTWTIDVTKPPPADMGTSRNVAFVNIYRTVTGASGSTVFFFVAQIPITQTVFADTVADTQVAQNIQLPSTLYFPPPPDLQGLINMPNGLVAGFVGNQIWICEPFLPHAWPPSNVFTVDFPIVGLGFTNGALVACTEANAFILAGASVAVMSLTKCAPPDPCLSRGSILSTDLGVYYQSPNGLIQVTNLGQSTNVTELWVTREKWATLTPLKNVRAVPMLGCYFAYGSTNGAIGSATLDVSVAQQGFMIELNQDNTSFTIWPQPGGHRVGFTQLTAPNNVNVDNITIDPWTGITLIIQNGQINYFDFTDPAPVQQVYKYTSKIYQQNTKKNFSAFRVYFTITPGTPVQTAKELELGTNDPNWNVLQPGQYAIVQVFASCGPSGQMQLVTSREVRKSGGLLRILGDFKAEEWQVSVQGRVQISNIQLATSIKELGNI